MTDAPANNRPTPSDNHEDLPDDERYDGELLGQEDALHQEELIQQISELIREKGLPLPESEDGMQTAASGCDICTHCILCTYAW